MNEQEQFDNYKIMNLTDLPDRYFVVNEQKLNFLPENFLEFDQDSYTIPAMKKTSKSDLFGIEYQSLQNRYEASGDNNNNNCSEANDMNDPGIDSGFRLTRQEYNRLVMLEQQKQQRKQMRRSVASKSANKSETPIKSFSNQEPGNIDNKVTNHNHYTNHNAFCNDGKRISSKNSPVLSV